MKVKSVIAFPSRVTILVTHLTLRLANKQLERILRVAAPHLYQTGLYHARENHDHGKQNLYHEVEQNWPGPEEEDFECRVPNDGNVQCRLQLIEVRLPFLQWSMDPIVR